MTDDKCPGFHSAFAVSNIRNHVQIILKKNSTTPYTSWAALFINMANTHDVLNHIDEQEACPIDVTPRMYKRLDVVVLNWIYSTISEDLLASILDPSNSALTAWNKLKAMFHDNKSTRAVYLEREFSNCNLAAYSDLDDYCGKLKALSDQLAAVESAPTATRMVIQLLAGLPAEYNPTMSIIQNTEPLPSFDKVCSQLKLEETRLTAQAKSAPDKPALISSGDVDSTTSRLYPDGPPPNRGAHRGGRGRGGRGGRAGRGGRDRGNGGYPNYPPRQPTFSPDAGWGY